MLCWQLLSGIPQHTLSMRVPAIATTGMQDPVARPSADELLEHEFVRYAEMPPDFAPRIADFLRRRPALAQQRRSGGGGSAGGGGGGGQYGTVTSANYATVPR